MFVIFVRGPREAESCEALSVTSAMDPVESNATLAGESNGPAVESTTAAASRCE
jgi:hypothetical protein